MNEIAFQKALRFTIGTGIGKDLGEEGGCVDNVHDHGGRTNRGITQHAYDEFRASRGLAFADVFDICQEEVIEFYRGVWVANHCDDMSLGLAVAHFDWSVNHGQHSIFVLQETLQVKADGIYGAKTRAALLDQDHDDLWKEYDALRRDWYRADVKRQPDQAVFLGGWLGRVDRLEAYIESL